MERLWKSVKEEYTNGLARFRPITSIEARLRSYARWFNECDPHLGLGQRMPDEVYVGKDARATAVPLRGELVVE